MWSTQSKTTVILLTAIAICLSSQQSILALGCETQELISGDISGSCGGFSSGDFGEIEPEKYQVCLEQQIIRAIAEYKADWNEFYTSGQKQPRQDVNSSQNPVQLSVEWDETRRKTYSVSIDLCQ